MSTATPIQRIKIGGEYVVLLPLREYESLVKAAQSLSARLDQISDAKLLDEDPPTKKVGHSPLKAWRKHRGFTAEQLAEKSGLARSYVYSLERGERRGTIQAWKKLAKDLEIEIKELIQEP